MELKSFKISFCIVCMNRLHQLKETLLKNLLDNQDYDNLEFLILNYNSRDGMDEWIKENMHPYLSTGRMTYYHTTDPQSFSHSHSKNMAFKLATGDIVCNINADHYTGEGFATFVNEMFNRNEKIVLTTVDYFKTRPDYNPAKDVFGKVCVKRLDFLDVGGFDERMDHYGFEDWDFINRLEMNGCKRTFIEDNSYLKFISHGQEERYSLDTEHIYGLYVNYLTPSTSEIIFLYQDRSYEKGVLIDNSTIRSENYTYAFTKRKHRFEYSVKDYQWIKGSWDENNEGIKLSNTNAHPQYLLRKDNELIKMEENAIYYPIVDSEIIENLITFNYFYHNRRLMEKNLKKKVIKVNNNSFGKASIVKSEV